MVTDVQVRKLMDELSKGAGVGIAAQRAGMHRNTARRYEVAGRLPSELRPERSWRTREDAFADDWSGIAERLEDAPELEAKALFEDLQIRRPGVYEEGQLRTFQRRVQRWRAESGPPKEIHLPQAHRPGEAMQTDFTEGKSLGITIAGEPFAHLLCHPVLPFSNWECAVVCRAESMLALRDGVQEAVFRLGRIPEWHQTDHSTAATHELSSGDRGFNREYAELMDHLGMKPRTIGVGQSQQNGDVEALNGALKRRLLQHLLLRGHRDFENVEAYQGWLDAVTEQANGLRTARFTEELAAMRPLTARRLPRFRDKRLRVTSNGTIRVANNIYSVPPRLSGEQVKVRVFDLHIEVLYAGRCHLTVDRLSGEGKHRVNYRHVIWSLVKKPWGFARYRYRDALFPTAVFRRAYEVLETSLPPRRADLEYLRVLHLAAATMECEVQAAVELLLGDDQLPVFDAVHALVTDREPEIPEMAPLTVDLASYDDLLVAEAGR